MKALCLFALTAGAAFCQPFGFGITGGVPLNDFLNAARSGTFTFSANTNRYVIGPTGELRLPFGLGIEVDALYRHFGYTGIGGITGVATSQSVTTGGAWEFPVLGKYTFKGKIAHPFVCAGVAWDKLSGLTQAVSSTVAGITKSSSTSNPAELTNTATIGYVFGGGLQVKFLLIHIAPQIRYTRWNSEHFVDPNGLLHSNLNQGEFLVSLTF